MPVLSEYQGLHEELQQILDDPPKLTDTEQIDTLGHLSDAIDDSEGSTTLKDEIVALGSAAAEIDTAFKAVSKAFDGINARNASSALVHDVVTLKSEWDKHHKVSGHNVILLSTTRVG